MKELCITIPCEPANTPDRVRPILVYLGEDSTGAANCEYKCPYCGQTGPRVKPLRRHMGMEMNVLANCPTLKKQDQARRSSREILGNLF